MNCDGSKEGWETSDQYDQIRSEFTHYLIEKSIDYVEISMDTDNYHTGVDSASSGSLLKIKSYYEHENF
ncbi:hypothetical protein GCM10008915_56530 [Bifidobacterium pullorum subsp. gallinarum]